METLPDWPSLLDELKCTESLASDSKLAATLGVTRGYICSVRKGRKGVSLELAKDIFSRLGRTFDVETIEQLFISNKVRSHIKILSAIREYVILRANGHCQMCGIEAPFKCRDGSPYLEVHHVVSLRNGGSSDASNLVALCPNCHRKITHLQDTENQEKLEKILEEYV